MPELKSDTPALAARGGDTRMKAILVLAAAVAFVTAPWLTAGFGGFAPDLFPIPQDRPPVQPAGYAFAIWGPIYLGLILHAGFGLLARAEDRSWDRGRWPLILSLAIGAGWIAVANANALLASVMIWVKLFGAVAALALTGPARAAGSTAGAWASGTPDRWVGQLPLGVYAGWLTAASWVAIGFLLGGYGVLSPVWAAAVSVPLAVATAVAVQLWLRRAPEYGLTVIWALVAVIVANWATAWGLVLLGLLGIAAMAATLAAVLRVPSTG